MQTTKSIFRLYATGTYPSWVRTRSSRPKYLCLSSSTKALCLWTGSSRPRMASASLTLISCSARFSCIRSASWFWSWADARSGNDTYEDLNLQTNTHKHKHTHTRNSLKKEKRGLACSCLIWCSCILRSETFFLNCRRLILRGTELLSDGAALVLGAKTGEPPVYHVGGGKKKNKLQLVTWKMLPNST